MADKFISVCGGIRKPVEKAEPVRRDRFTAQAEDFEIVSLPPKKRTERKPKGNVPGKGDADKT